MQLEREAAKWGPCWFPQGSAGEAGLSPWAETWADQPEVGQQREAP